MLIRGELTRRVRESLSYLIVGSESDFERSLKLPTPKVENGLNRFGGEGGADGEAELQAHKFEDSGKRERMG